MTEGTETRAISRIPIAEIIPPKVALRTVDKSTDQWKHFVESIKHSGIINAIALKRVTEKDENGVEHDRFQIIEGLHRWTAAVDLGLEEVPAQILDADEAETLELQIEGNVHKFETKPVQYSKQLLKILAQHPGRTVKEQAARLSKSEGWLKDKLRLQRLTPEIQTLVDQEKIPLSSAYVLAKMDEEEQAEWAGKAMELPPDQFLPQCSNRINELRKLKKGEPKPDPSPSAVVRKRGDILDMYRSLPDNYKSESEKGFCEAIKWVVQMDEASTKDWYTKREEAKKKAEAVRAAKKAESDARKSELPSIDDLLK